MSKCVKNASRNDPSWFLKKKNGTKFEMTSDALESTTGE